MKKRIRVDQDLLKSMEREVAALSIADNIGKLVKKKTNKPFKSQSRINTIKDVILHPRLGIPAYTFVEDDSYVDCNVCVII